MPKDRAHNIGAYEAPQSKLNEYEFAQNHEAISKEEDNAPPFMNGNDALESKRELLEKFEGKSTTQSASTDDPTRDDEENELEAEQESAEAMDSDVPQPPQADETTEGQPS